MEDNKFVLSNFYNNYTLNIFSDGSYKNGISTYGIIALEKDFIVNGQVVKTDDINNINLVELKAIRASLSMARSYLGKYKYINIFSDSKTSVAKVLKYYNSTKNTTNQTLLQIKEIYKLIDACPDTLVTIYYTPGHVSSSRRGIKESHNKFMNNNNLESCDVKLIKYLARGNDLVDRSCTMYRKYNYADKTICPINLLGGEENDQIQ